MPSKVITAQLASGRTIYIEASAKGEQAVANIAQPFGDFADAMSDLAKSIASAVDAVKPDAAEVEFGVEVSLESGKLTTLLVKGTGSANIKVTLRWGKS